MESEYLPDDTAMPLFAAALLVRQLKSDAYDRAMEAEGLASSPSPIDRQLAAIVRQEATALGLRQAEFIAKYAAVHAADMITAAERVLAGGSSEDVR